MTLETRLFLSIASATTLAAMTTPAQAQLEVSVGVDLYWEAGFDEPSDNLSTFDEDFDVTIGSGNTLDNGLTFDSRISLDDADDSFGSDIDETTIFLSGSFGSVLIGDDDPAAYGAGTRLGCDGSFSSSAGQNRYFTPSFSGFQFGAGYITDVENERGAMATENPPGTVQNPAFSLDGALSGYEISGQATACAEIFNLPTYFSFGADYHDLSGSGYVMNQNFANGLGFTGIGVTPGTFINSATDVTRADYWSDRWGSSATFQFDEPLFVNFAGLRDGDDIFPSTTSLSLAKGIRGGVLNQQDRVDIATDSPAFGANSASTFRYDTTFDGSFVGVYGGLSLDFSKVLSKGHVFTTSLSATGGYDWYNFNVHDSVDAQGLGGAINVMQQNDLNYHLGTPTASVSASIGLDTGKVAYSGYGGVTWGQNPSLDYDRPDSLPGPVTLDPTLGLKLDMSYKFGAAVNVKFD